jgi:hypothetical protein
MVWLWGHYITTKGSMLVRKGEPYVKGQYPRSIDVYICKECFDRRENDPRVIEERKQFALREEFYHTYLKGENRYQTKDGAKRFYPRKKRKKKERGRKKSGLIGATCGVF